MSVQEAVCTPGTPTKTQKPTDNETQGLQHIELPQATRTLFRAHLEPC